MTSSISTEAWGGGGYRQTADATAAGALSTEVTLVLEPFGQLAVRLQVDGETILATEQLTSCYGVGATAPEAIRELAEAIRRHHAFLRDTGRDRLSAALQRQLDVLEHGSRAARRLSLAA
jgi:predicted RNase H-like HicB family nuclease